MCFSKMLGCVQPWPQCRTGTCGLAHQLWVSQTQGQGKLRARGVHAEHWGHWLPQWGRDGALGPQMVAKDKGHADPIQAACP